ncbi:MAG TPA: response regulator, partial [Chitinophagaceae bacterium]|nr:response regulator [Chitinophagaceae bacterium]
NLELTYKNKGLLLVLVIAAVMIVVAIVIYRSLDVSGLSSKQLAASRQIDNSLKRVEAAITRQDFEIRDYILNVANHPKSVANTADSLLARVHGYTAQVNRLHVLVAKKDTFIAAIAAKIDSGQTKIAIELLNTRLDRRLADSIRLIAAGITSIENYRLKAAAADEVNNNRGIFVLLSAGIMLCLVLLALFYLVINKNTKLQAKTQGDLAAARNQAETADKAKGSFLATMSHEIRSPLHDIISTACLLEETNLTNEQQEFTAIIQQSSLTLLTAVNDIIDFSNIESGRLPIENAAFVLKDCIEEVLAAGNTANSINFSIDPQLPELINGDAIRLRQVLLTITGSLLKSSIACTVQCDIKMVAQNNTRLEIEFALQATNEGSEAHRQDNFFGMSSVRFSMAARLVSLMGGNIKVTTNTGSGSNIVFTIVAGKVDEEGREKFIAAQKTTRLQYDSSANKTPLHILAADDNELNLAILVQVLSKMGHTCKTARNGLEASGMAIEENFDVIFMDIFMPVMDGIESTRRIREFYMHTGTPLIVGVTANALFAEKQAGFDAGINDFLIKPYRPADIKALIEKWMAMLFTQKYNSPSAKEA